MDMMKSCGESSSKGQENGDERPLKKARFAWQVKGKYHLKNDTDDSDQAQASSATETSINACPGQWQNPTKVVENEADNFFTHEESVMNPGLSLYFPVVDISTQTPYPRYSASKERNVMTMSCGNSNTKTKSLVLSEDQCITDWQVKQVVNGCLDNTLNRILETWSSDSVPANAIDPQYPSREFAEFINQLPGDNSVENEGILMAISAHGLQNTSSSNESSSRSEKCALNITNEDSQISKTQSGPVTNTNDSYELENWTSNVKNITEISKSTKEYTPSECSEEAHSPYMYHDDIESSNNDLLEMDGNFDFMDAAVMFAIKSKGLTASGTEYG